MDHAGSRKIKPNQAWIKQNAPGFSWITRDQAWIRGIKLGLSRIKHGSSLDRARIKQNTAAPGRVPLAAHIERSAPPNSPQLALRARPPAGSLELAAPARASSKISGSSQTRQPNRHRPHRRCCHPRRPLRHCLLRAPLPSSLSSSSSTSSSSSCEFVMPSSSSSESSESSADGLTEQR